MRRPHHHLDRSRLKHGWTASEPVRSLHSNLSYLLFAVTLTVEEIGKLRGMEEEGMEEEGMEEEGMEEEGMIRTGWQAMRGLWEKTKEL